MRSRIRRAALITVAAVLALGGAATAATSRHHHVFRGKRTVLSAAEIKRLSAGTRRPSIIVFKNQLKNLPATASAASARARAANALQAPVRAELARVHATHVKGFHIINAVAASITPAEAQHLRSDQTIQAVVPDTFRHFATLDSGPGPAAVPDVASTGPQPICPSDPSKPMIEPEARQVMNVDAAEQIVDGSGIRVGIVADGLDPNNPDLIRPNGQHVIFDYQDFSGFGTNAPSDGRESFLDAGTIASQANQTYDLSGFVNPAHPLPPGCNIKIAGIAPGASLAVINLSGPNAGFFNSTIVQGIEWAVLHDHVNVLNESIGGNPLPNTEDDPVSLADQAAVAAGVTVVASSGDAGPFNNIGSPATTPGVIAVGGTTTYRVYRQTTRYGTQLSPGGWEDNNITALSSDGIDEFNPDTVDVVAPGDRGWSLCSHDTTKFFGCADIDKGANPPPIWAAGGTSASAPETSGTAALVLEAYANTHGGRFPAPALVERIITSTANDLGAPADRQGAGLVNTLKAVQLAESIDRGANQGRTLLLDQKSLNATLNAGQSHTFTVHATNEGSAPQTVSPSVVGRPTPMSDDTGAVTLSNASPTYIDGEGNTDFYALHTFTVGPGADYLTGDITWNAASKGTAVFETLFDPQGQVAAYSLIGSDQSGFGHVEVRKPNAGTWTAVIFTVNNAAVYSGQVQFNYEAQAFHGAGSVSPASQTLAPGQTGAFNVTVKSGQAGDEGLRLHLGTGGPDDGSIPIVVRSLVPLGRAGGTFAGTLTGGGSTGNAGQQFTYQFNVPNGEPSLNAAIQTTDANSQLTGYLVDPEGQPVSEQSNAVFDASDNLLGFGKSMQFFRGSPQGGLWTLTLGVSGPVAGQHLREPFTGAITFAGPPVTSTGIPSKVKAGHPVTATIKVTNTGSVRKDFFADARLNGKTQQVLLGSGANDVGLPLSLFAQPNWLVPTNTDAFSVLAKGTIPITTEISFFSGDPDALGGSIGSLSAARVTAPELAPGFYFDLPEPTGPFGATGVPAGSSVDLVGIADTNPFDANVTASSGDVWAQSIDATAPYTPLSLAPGQTGTITLTFNATGRRGSVVRGFVDVDTFNLASLGGDEVTSIPYAYKLG
jgi:subtilisin family serine protease